MSQAQHTWQPIETAPKGTRWTAPHILCSDGEAVWITHWHRCTCNGELVYNDWQIGKPTHWMPLPDPPVAQKEGRE